MDNSNFSTCLDIVNTGILKGLHSTLMQGNKNKKIQPEMYKLNVYGEYDSEIVDHERENLRATHLKVLAPFSKHTRILPMVRTCSVHSSSFSLLATKVEPFNSVIRVKNGTFDSAAITSMQKVPSIAYVAFYSDVEHEVSMVTSGYRVTMTYNLYFDDTKSNPSHSWMKEDELALHTSLSTLLDHRDFLPDSRYLGFSLEFMYPVARGSIKRLINSLKGSDAMIKLVLDQLDLQPQVKIIYRDNQEVYHPDPGPGDKRFIKRPHIMLDGVDQFLDWQIEEPFQVVLPEYAHGIVIRGADEVGEYWDGGGVIRAKKVLWITPQTMFSRVKGYIQEE